MPVPTEHKAVQQRILRYASEVGWTYVSRAEAEERRGFVTDGTSSTEKAAKSSLYFEDLLYSKVREFNPSYKDALGELIGRLILIKTDIEGNRDFLKLLRNESTFFDAEQNRELNFKVIDYKNPSNNTFEVTEEFYYHNGRYGNREDVVFLINGIPVLVIECKNVTKEEAIAIGIDQLRRYHDETPEFFVPQMVFTVTEAIGFCYGVTWNLARRNIFNWKHDQLGQLEAKVKSFLTAEHVLSILQHWILFAEKDEELNKYILCQHQTEAVKRVINRCHDRQRSRGLVWHTQGSGKTFTMIKVAEMLFKAPESEKPTILLMIDRNELEDQMLKNLEALGLENVRHADRIRSLVKLLQDDYRGIIVTTIHKFRDMPADVSTRSNVYVLIDEAHRTTGGDLGNFLMAALPNASFIGFTGTPIDKTVYGKGTFKVFGVEDEQGYLHKYSIRESIEDGTTLPLYYNLAPNAMLANEKLMEEEFWSIAETEGISDIETLNRILDRAVNLKNFLKGSERVDKIAEFVADHYLKNVEPLGYKAFLVAVDREGCAKYKKALDKHLPSDYSAVVYTAGYNDSKELKAYHIDDTREKEIRRDFSKAEHLPKILIVTEKLLTGYDAPILYAMYLDKPMRDHTLLQAIARVNRPYESEGGEKVKPHGFVLDFVGIFGKLEKALAFDSNEVSAIVRDLKLLKTLFKNKMEEKVPKYLQLIQHNFDDRDVDILIEHFRDKDRRKEFFKEYKELEMLYEIISPDAFLRPYLEDYATVSQIYRVVRNAYTRRVGVDRAFQRKTSELVQKHVDTEPIKAIDDVIAIDGNAIEIIKRKKGGEGTKVINLLKNIEKTAEEQSDDPFLIALADRARAIEEAYEDRQMSTQEALESLLAEINRNEQRKKEQSEKGFDGLTFFVYKSLSDAEINNAEEVSKRIRAAFAEHPDWRRSESQLREVRKAMTFEIYREVDDIDRVAEIVDDLLSLLTRAYDIS